MEWQKGKAVNPIIENRPETYQNRSKIEFIDNVEQKSTVAPQPEKYYPESLILSEGQTLRTISLELFGSKEFWVYIYQENIHNIKNPNVIPAGTQLQIPDLTRYDINPDNPQSVAKAKEKGDKILDTL